MKPCLVLLVLVLFRILASAQSEERDLRTLLQDSSYVFNRFEETITGLDSQIDTWNVPESSKKLFKTELSGTLQNVRAEKPALNASLLKNDVSSTDLFDVYSEVLEVTSELQGQASNFSNWGDTTKAIELAQLGAKADILAVNIGIVLRGKIEALQAEWEACATKSRPPSAKHR